MEEQLENLKSVLNLSPKASQKSEDFLEEFLLKNQSEFSLQQKKLYPTCAAYYALFQSQNSLKLPENDPEINTEDFLQHLQYFSSKIHSKGENSKLIEKCERTLKYFRLYQKLYQILMFLHLYTSTSQKIIWELFLLTNETEDNIEEMLYLLNFLVIKYSKKAEEQQVNEILAKQTLEKSKMNEFEKSSFQICLEKLEKDLNFKLSELNDETQQSLEEDLQKLIQKNSEKYYEILFRDVNLQQKPSIVATKTQQIKKIINFSEQTCLNTKLSEIMKLNNQQQQIINGKESFKIPSRQMPQPPQTPISTSLENYKWLNLFSKSESTHRLDYFLSKIGNDYKEKTMKEAQEIIKDIYYKCKKKIETQIENRVQRTLNLYQNILERIIIQEESRIDNENQLFMVISNQRFQLSVLTNCIITISFIQDTKDIQLNYLLEKCNISSLDLWKTISNFAHADKYMPDAIKENLFNLEGRLLLYNVWEDKDLQMHQILKKYVEEKKPFLQQQQIIQQQHYMDMVCKRLIHHTALRIYEIALKMNLNDIIREKIWDSVKYVFQNQSELLERRFVDQIIICCIYAIYMLNKTLFQQEIKFKYMISQCEDIPFFQSEKVKKTYSGNSEQEDIDIINFYNKIFLQPMKVYFKDNNFQTPLSHENNKVLQSPLIDSIPKVFLAYTPVHKINAGSSTPIQQQQMPIKVQKLQ